MTDTHLSAFSVVFVSVITVHWGQVCARRTRKLSLIKEKDLSLPCTHIVQERCESRGGRPELSVLTSLLVSVDVKLY